MFSLSSYLIFHFCCCLHLSPGDLQSMTEPKIDGSEFPSRCEKPRPCSMAFSALFLSLETYSFIPVVAQIIIHNFSTPFTERGTLSQLHLHRLDFGPHYLPCRHRAPGHLCLVPDPEPGSPMALALTSYQKFLLFPFLKKVTVFSV